MDLEEIIKKRRSVRTFEKTDISDTMLNQVIELAHRAPSAGAIRAYPAFITRKKISERVPAPVYLIICTDPKAYSPRYGRRGSELYSIQDATIFGAYIQLILVNKGLASVWIGAFRENKMKRFLKTDLKPIAIIAVGYEKQPETQHE